MCLAIYKPGNIEIPVKYLETGFENHSDGAGMAWAVDGKLYFNKGMFTLEDVLEQYEKIKAYPALIHFRKATHGKIDAANCHPFIFNDGKLALIHNGILPIKCCIEGLSDTAHFVKLVLEPIIKTHKVPINDGALNYLICTSIGSDKMAIMDGQGKTFIFNEDKGNWDGGAWYSNTSFRFVYTTITKYPQSPYFHGAATSFGSCAGTVKTGYKHTNWRKHWADKEDEDETYLEFWRKSRGANSASTVNGCSSSPSQTQTGPLLLEDVGDGLENVGDGVDDAGNVITDKKWEPKFQPGEMCEYGWYDVEIEEEALGYQTNLGLSREEAVIRVFSSR